MHVSNNIYDNPGKRTYRVFKRHTDYSIKSAQKQSTYSWSSFAYTHVHSVIRLNPADMSTTVLTLSIGKAYGATAYNGKIYVTSNRGDGVAILDAATSTEVAGSPLAFASTCMAWEINQYRGVAYINCNNGPPAASEDTCWLTDTPCFTVPRPHTYKPCCCK